MTKRTLTVSGAITGLLMALLAAAPAQADDGCPVGQSADGYTGECTLDITPASYDGPLHAGFSTDIVINPYGGGEIPSVNGIPCTPEHIGTCIGMGYNQVPHQRPQSTISHSP